MIQLLKHKESPIATEILSISLQAYQVEAETIGASDFPPLAEKIVSIINCDNLFYGFLKNGRIMGVMEMENESHGWTIARLAVSPQFFRQGVGSNLVAYAVDNYQPCSVSTAVNNLPALTLYEKHGFIKSSTTHAITPEITIVTLNLPT